MNAFVLKLLQMGVQGSLLILAAALIRFALLRVLPKGMLRLLWVPAILALLVPLPVLFHLSLPLPELRREEVSLGEAESARMDWDSWEAVSEPENPGILSGETEGEASRGSVPVLPLVWAAGAGSLGLAVLALYLREYARFRRAVPLAGVKTWLGEHPTRRKLRLRLLPDLPSPMTYGVFRPYILLREEPDWDSLTDLLTLEHEYIHVRHLDAAWKLLLHVLLILHWYNPAVWLMYGLLGRDLELSCDESVLRRFGRETRADFAQMLVDSGRRRRLAPYPGLGAGVLRERVNAIMRYRRAGVLRRCLASCLVLCLCLCALCTVRAGAVGETLYRSGGMVLSVPRELKELLIVETPALTGESEEVLFRVLERETWEAGKELYPDSRREYGLILTVLRMDETGAAKTIQNRAAAWDLLARDEQGYYYLAKRASVEANMLTSPETEDQDARWERRKLVNLWVRELRAHLSWKGSLRTSYPAFSSTVASYLAGALYSRSRRYSLNRGEETVRLQGENEGSVFLNRLTWETAAESARVFEQPQGEPIIVSHPYRQRILYFWPGSDLVLYCSDKGAVDSVRYWYTATLLDAPGEKVGDLAEAWFLWARANQTEQARFPSDAKAPV